MEHLPNAIERLPHAFERLPQPIESVHATEPHHYVIEAMLHTTIELSYHLFEGSFKFRHSFAYNSSRSTAAVHISVKSRAGPGGALAGPGAGGVIFASKQGNTYKW